jgi:hypothetical protein
VCKPTFDAFSDSPVAQSLIGERMLQIFAQEGSQAGRNVIPTIAFRSEDSLRRQVGLVASLYPRVNTVMIDCNGSNVDPTLWKWRWLFALHDHFAGLPPIRWIISDITAGWAIRELNEIFQQRNLQPAGLRGHTPPLDGRRLRTRHHGRPLPRQGRHAGGVPQRHQGRRRAVLARDPARLRTGQAAREHLTAPHGVR